MTPIAPPAKKPCPENDPVLDLEIITILNTLDGMRIGLPKIQYIKTSTGYDTYHTEAEIQYHFRTSSKVFNALEWQVSSIRNRFNQAIPSAYQKQKLSKVYDAFSSFLQFQSQSLLHSSDRASHGLHVKAFCYASIANYWNTQSDRSVYLNKMHALIEHLSNSAPMEIHNPTYKTVFTEGLIVLMERACQDAAFGVLLKYYQVGEKIFFIKVKPQNVSRALAPYLALFEMNPDTNSKVTFGSNLLNGGVPEASLIYTLLNYKRRHHVRVDAIDFSFLNLIEFNKYVTCKPFLELLCQLQVKHIHLSYLPKVVQRLPKILQALPSVVRLSFSERHNSRYNMTDQTPLLAYLRLGQVTRLTLKNIDHSKINCSQDLSNALSENASQYKTKVTNQLALAPTLSWENLILEIMHSGLSREDKHKLCQRVVEEQYVAPILIPCGVIKPIRDIIMNYFFKSTRSIIVYQIRANANPRPPLFVRFLNPNMTPFAPNLPVHQSSSDSLFFLNIHKKGYR